LKQLAGKAVGEDRSNVIDCQEIMDFSREFALTASTIEKEHVLGWLLAGIAQQGIPQELSV
jgi:hypothetical protein